MNDSILLPNGGVPEVLSSGPADFFAGPQGDSGRYGDHLSSIAATLIYIETRRHPSFRARPAMKFHMDEPLRFWVDVAYDEIKADHINLTTRQLVAQILRQYERRGDAMRHLDNQGKIAWKASPRFLTLLADAERDAHDDLEDFP